MTVFRAVLLLVAALPAFAQHDPPALQEQTRARAYPLRIRFERVYLGRTDCSEMGLDDLKVRLRDEHITDRAALSLDREPRPTLHVLLIDTSASMNGRLEAIRRAASTYIERLQPEYDRALVASFDESVVLRHGVTADHERLLEAIAGLRLSYSTALHDAIYYAARELAVHRERGVIVLLTDGIDTTSLHDRNDVRAVLEARPDATLFPISLGSPPMGVFGSSDAASSRRFLQRLAVRTGGEYFEAHTAGSLDKIYRRIGDLLDNEAVLTVTDPDPTTEPGRVRVRSRNPDCRVEVLGPVHRDEPLSEEVTDDLRLIPDPVLIDPHTSPSSTTIDPACEPADGASSRWSITEVGERLRGCTLDVSREFGMLFDPAGPVTFNTWAKMRTRPFEVPVPPFDRLPDRPELWLDSLTSTVAAAGDDVETDESCQPPEKHARPYHDQPQLVHGVVFFDLRPALARAIDRHDDYRAWARERIRDEAERESQLLARRLHVVAPERSAEEILEIARDSEAGRRILARIEQPAEADLQRTMAGWLGDVTAHDLFARWEALHVNRALEHGVDPSFSAAWTELYDVFRLPSYSRTLTLLAPVRDTTEDRIGFWRIVLPRVAWFRPRTAGRRYGDLADLPLDLVPDRPLAYWLVTRLLDADSDLARSWVVENLTVRYVLTGKPRRQDFDRAFDEVRVTLAWGADAGSQVVVEIERDPDKGIAPRIRRFEVETVEPDETTAMLEAAGRRLVALDLGITSRKKRRKR